MSKIFPILSFICVGPSITFPSLASNLTVEYKTFLRPEHQKESPIIDEYCK